MKGFRAFLRRGNVVDLAVAVVIGAAFGALITSLVKDLITPLIAALGGQPDFSALTFAVNKSVFRYDDFLNAVIAFAIIAAVIYYLVVVPYTAFMSRRRTADASTKTCPECLSEIPLGARRCAFCTVVLP
jgi:large conductance mechanosensitive channel